MGKCLSTPPKEDLRPNTQEQQHKRQQKQSKNQTSDIARANAAIAAQNRMQNLEKVPQKIKSANATPQKIKMVAELDAMDQRQKQLEQMRKDRIDRGLSVE